MARPNSYTRKTTYSYDTYISIVSPTEGRRKIRLEYLLNPPCKLIDDNLNNVVDHLGNKIIMKSGNSSPKRITGLDNVESYTSADYILIFSPTYGVRKILATDLFGEVE